MKIRLENVRLSFPYLFTAQEQEGGKKTFNASFILKAGDPQIKKIENAIADVAKAKWGAKADAVLKQLKASDKVALHDGDTKTQYDGYEGNMYISSSRPSTNGRPLLIDRNKSPLTEEDGKLYSGCYVNAIIELWAQDNNFGKRINASLQGVQFDKDGDRFAGGSSADESDFDELADGADADDLV